MNIYEKLQSARVDLQNKKLKKSGKNKFAGFEYFELSDFLPVVNGIFNELKLFSRFLINEKQATLEIVNAEKTDETILFSMPTAELELKGCNKLQALGGVNTYLRRYLYLNALEIVEADLFDAEAGKEEKPKQPAKPVITVTKVAEKPEDDAEKKIFDKINQINDLEELAEHYFENKEQIKDVKAFNKAVNDRKKELSDEH